LTYFEEQLDQAQQVKLATIHPRKKAEFILSRTLLKYGLTHHKKDIKHIWHILERSQLPPLVTPVTQTKFSLSHSGTMIGIAVCDSNDEIGFDLQQFKSFKNQRLAIESARQFCSEAEYQDLKHLIDNETLFTKSFTELWTLKEAFFKSRHCGMLNENIKRTHFTVSHEQERNCATSYWQDSHEKEYQLAIYNPEYFSIKCHFLEIHNNEFKIQNEELIWQHYKIEESPQTESAT